MLIRNPVHSPFTNETSIMRASVIRHRSGKSGFNWRRTALFQLVAALP